MKGLLKAIDAEIKEEEAAIMKRAKDFSKDKKAEMKKRAEEDNAKLFSIERKNIDAQMRKKEERIREEYLLELVKTRESLVDDAWEDAKKRFLSMPKRKREYTAFMKKLLKMAKADGSFDVYLRKEDRHLWKGAKTAKMSGGLVMKSKDGKIERDYSIDGIVDTSEEGARALIAEVLFK